jgi:hypothetical protein
MSSACTLVVTTIASPNGALTALATGAAEAGWSFIAIGDAKSPADFGLTGCRFFSLADQVNTGFSYAQQCPANHYARKNIGYLIAAREGAERIVETDDDNVPRRQFFEPRVRRQEVAVSTAAGWVNAYRWFTDDMIWPRGFPPDRIHAAPVPVDRLPVVMCDCPIQQGLADENPDVDALYRLTFPLPRSFARDERVAIGEGSWCPFNSQNTTWFDEAFELLYLPACCSFRMTDIWRSLVVQRIAWENGWSILFHGATVRHERNAHDVMRDFAQEIPGYLNNDRIATALAALPIRAGTSNIGDNLRLCYEQLVRMELVGGAELALLDAWLSDVTTARAGRCPR